MYSAFPLLSDASQSSKAGQMEGGPQGLKRDGDGLTTFCGDVGDGTTMYQLDWLIIVDSDFHGWLTVVP